MRIRFCPNLVTCLSFLIIFILTSWRGVDGQTTANPCNITSTIITSARNDTGKCWTKEEFLQALNTTTATGFNASCNPDDELRVTSILDILRRLAEDNHTFSGVSEDMIANSCNRLIHNLVCNRGQRTCECAPGTFLNNSVCLEDRDTIRELTLWINNMLRRIENLPGWQTLNQPCDADMEPTFDSRLHGWRELEQIANGQIQIARNRECLFTKNLVCQSTRGGNGTCKCSPFTTWKRSVRNGTCAVQDGRSCEKQYQIKSRQIVIRQPCFSDDATCTEAHEEDSSDDTYFVCCPPGMNESEDDICLNSQSTLTTTVSKVIVILAGINVIYNFIRIAQ